MFFDSSVRSTRTIVLRPSRGPCRSAPAGRPAARRRPACCDRSRRKSASAPEPVHPDLGVLAPGAARATCRRSSAANASAQRRVRKPSRSAPSMPAQQLPRDVVRQQPEVVRRRPRRVREVRRSAGRGGRLAEHARAPGPGGSPAPAPPRPRPPPRRAPRRRRGCTLSYAAHCAPELRVEDRLQRGLVQHVVDEPQHGVRDAVVRGGVARRRRCPASGHAVRRCRPDPGAAVRVRPPGRRRRARRTPTPRPRRARWRDSPETSPPPPRLAVSEPSSASAYETGPRLDATRTWAPAGPHCARKPCRESNPLHIGANVRNSPTSCPAARRPPGTGEPAAQRPHGTPPREGISRAWCPCCGRSSATSRRRTAC